MNFDFSDELKQLREEARRFLREQGLPGVVRERLEGRADDGRLWRDIAALGWTGATIEERHGGSGLGPLAACVLAEELGRAAAPLPFASSVCLATEALLRFGSAAQQDRWLPKLADGSAIGTVAIAEGDGPLHAGGVAARAGAQGLQGTKLPVTDGLEADFAVVAAQGPDGLGLQLVELAQAGVQREALPSLDRSRPQARLAFDNAQAQALPGAQGWNAVRQLLDRAAVMLAFEQIGGAQAALEMARDYALQRYAFGRPIASFQAIKHKLADVYAAIELARSNAWFAAWALDRDAPELPQAAAAARIAATDAAWLATKENVQTHGGMGYTWELDCHIYYRRARVQSLALGGVREWKRRLMDVICPLEEAAQATQPVGNR